MGRTATMRAFWPFGQSCRRPIRNRRNTCLQFAKPTGTASASHHITGTAMHWMFLPLRRSFDYAGRSCRMEFWMYFILQTVLPTLIMMVGLYQGLVAVGEHGNADNAVETATTYFGPTISLTGLVIIALLIPGIALQVRRFHDQDRSGLWVLLNLIPLFGGVAVLVFMGVEGTKGDNRFGPDPRRP